MLFIIDTASTGYWPAADSADSMIASAPSNTAIDTSDTSARVGTGAVIIDSSIWVATTTGLPARRQARVICFWMPGTASIGISTPRSPRATMTASESSMISASRATAAGVPDTEVLGDPEHRLPHVVTFSSLYVDGEAVVDELDRAGFAVGSGSACTASTLRPSLSMV